MSTNGLVERNNGMRVDSEQGLYEKLEEYSDSDYYPFHMPGHKRNIEIVNQKNFYELDITEIENFDNLHHAQGILKEAQIEAAKLYHSDYAYFLVNGSTCGILSAISAVTEIGDMILVSRNSHKAVYHGIELRNLQATYLYPTFIEEFDLNGVIEPEQVAKALVHNDKIKAVMITSPTMQGVVSDVGAIAKICHTHGVPLIVDEAHGAHFGFANGFPNNSNQCGADIVIQSLHKTLPSLTQTAMLHVNGNLVNHKEIAHCLQIYQTSSPSYLLMASIIHCNGLMKSQAAERMSRLEAYWTQLIEGTKDLKCIRIAQLDSNRDYKNFRFDLGKVIISTKNTACTGPQLYDILLYDYHLQMEMVAETYVMAIITGDDTEAGIVRLIQALQSVDKQIKHQVIQDEESQASLLMHKPECSMTLYEALHKKKKVVPIEKSIGCISGEYVFVYPPGIPVLIPGERITSEMVYWIQKYKQTGLNIQGLDDKEINVISIII